MKLLIIGGTKFLGRHLVEAALNAGHTVTLFNRGRTNPDLFPEVEKIHGDRDGQLDLLAGRRWDAVIDTCGSVPRVVSASARLLADKVDHYTFISTISVYADNSAPDEDESAGVDFMDDPTSEEVTGRSYGALKALCEEAAEGAMPGRVLTVRAGLIVGPHDPTGRYTYWVERVARGGEVLAPDSPEVPVQYIDVRDLSEWILRMAAGRRAGVYNVTGPAKPYTMGEFLAVCRAVSGSDARFTWVPEPVLMQRGVVPWVDLPLWVPESMAGFSTRNIDKALAAGLTFRSPETTVRDTLAWAATLGQAERGAGLKPEQEAGVLAAWNQR
ncbi:MAG TPA: SDR family oxidoreductase [Symbiobacteriaceae bacterium]|jgi:2'-hydroxyisoflavone reductase